VVIEDDAEVAYLLEVILVQAGFDVEVARDGLAGVEAVRRRVPDLTTVELALPDIDGLEVTRRIRAFSGTYVVVVSSRSGEDDILGSFAAGADDYAVKPFRPRELRARFLAGLRRPQERLLVDVALPTPRTPGGRATAAPHLPGDVAEGYRPAGSSS
jgi:DNA-binding response OmpR family regulator